tara:strand:- start:635 stop:1147 length:513 start_codon:yes stop_codon:yes gene_type:complete
LEISKKTSFSYDDLIACGDGKLFSDGGPPLPSPPMLMFDSITKISSESGDFNKGEVIAELNINKDLWFFNCHFKNDPVMPGCLGLDALWQLLGFHLGWLGGKGSGRALAVGSVKFTGQILPSNKKLIYKLDIKRIIMRKLILGIANGKVICDDDLVYEADDIKVGLFKKD